MQDILIPVGLLLFIGLFVFAFIHTARRQRQAKSGAFSEYAQRHGLRYLDRDNGLAQRFAHGFEGLDRFNSPSLGEVIPDNVVHGTLGGFELIVFHHSIRFEEGWAREWFVAGVTADDFIARGCTIQFCNTDADRDAMYLSEPVIGKHQAGRYNLAIRAANTDAAGRLMDGGTLERLAGLATELSFRPEVQVRDRRIAVYPADRNASLQDVESLEELVQFTLRAARI